MPVRTKKNVGVIGLGIIGHRVALCLRRRGIQPFVWNRTPRPFPNFVGSPAELADLCDIIQIFVSDDDALLETLGQIRRSLTPQHIVLVHSTVAPYTMRAAAEIVQRRGAELLDAPFTGSKGAAEAGELTYYIGGTEETLAKARRVLEASSKEIVMIGKIGDATSVKVATNMITAVTVQVAAEALALARHLGIAPEKFSEAMQNNGSNSGTLGLKLPKIIDSNFEPQFSVKHMFKDVEIATRLARTAGLNVDATSAAREALANEMKAGRGDLDYSSVAHQFFPRAGDTSSVSGDREAEELVLPGLTGSDQAPVLQSESGEALTTPVAEKSTASDEASVETESDDLSDSEVAEREIAEVGAQTDSASEEVEKAPGRGVALPPLLDEFPDATRPDSETLRVSMAEPSPAVAEQREQRRGLLGRLLGRGAQK